MQAYSDPNREQDPTALPDIELFEIDGRGYSDGKPFVLCHDPGETAYGLAEPGWYYWMCFPGCLPDSDPLGPFRTMQEALDDAREGLEEV